MATKPVAVYQQLPRLIDSTVKEALAINKDHTLYRSIVQIIDDMRTDRLLNSVAYYGENNERGAMACLSQWDILNTLLQDLEARRAAANQD